MTLAALLCLAMTMTMQTACSSEDENTTDDKSKPTYKYLHYADARDNMSAEEQAQYAAYCWRLERKDKAQQPKNWRTCQGEFSPNEESELFPDPEYQPSKQGLRELNISGSSGGVSMTTMPT